MKKVLLTTGGTGGHIYPALAVAENLKSKGIDTIFVGSNLRMEKDLVPASGYKFIGLDIKVPRDFKNIFSYIKTVFEAYKIVKREKPDAIIGFGNYISIPVVFSGVLQRKKVYLQEQNVNLGFANKLFYKFAKMTFLAFEKTYDDMPMKHQKKFKVTGNPLRKEVENLNYDEEREKLGIKEDEEVLLITGGSLGAEEINDGIIENWEKIKDVKNLRIFWATGKNNYEKVISKIEKRNIDRIDPYFEDMLSVMTASDLVICRAGALTISEVIELERPSIIIPYSSKKVGQYDNAKMLEDTQASYVYLNKKVNEAIEKALILIKNSEELKKMRIRLKSLKKSKASEEIIANLDIWRN
ncbi:MAG: undecaprenyldiphospho-muramoylpentapeptide beta-N-acetylglucosaminyltransferase [Fusobacteriales bacterium]|nr:undecaprenyldiphospho-muramoylpentapeptide beta-N-acetylglucosaminyltransferase [Fusobacterium sp.]PID67101.1 MAG: undecaprenyldiphospho-muramoylpentapeptide beta-N-acetylglucosaminyltransferase [Fusobacteriales bacterium]